MIAEPTAPVQEKRVILEGERIPLRCATCGLPFGYLVLKDGVILIESRHHGQTHQNIIPLVASRSMPDECPSVGCQTIGKGARSI